MNDTARENIDGLRTHLFAQLRELRATASTDVEALKSAIAKAGAVSGLAKAITDTARVEVDYLRANAGGESDFLASKPAQGDGAPAQNLLPNGIVGIRRHLLRDE